MARWCDSQPSRQDVKHLHHELLFKLHGNRRVALRSWISNMGFITWWNSIFLKIEIRLSMVVPWMPLIIMLQCGLVPRFHLFFRQDSSLVWIRFPCVGMEYYDENVLIAPRGKFASFCWDTWFNVEYEGLHLFARLGSCWFCKTWFNVEYEGPCLFARNVVYIIRPCD